MHQIELADTLYIFSYGISNGNALEAIQERYTLFPQRRVPNENVHGNFRDHGGFRHTCGPPNLNLIDYFLGYDISYS